MKQSKWGIASLILGIFAILLMCIDLGAVLGALGLIFSIIAFAQKNKKYGTAIAGMICSIIAIVLFILFSSVADTENNNSESTEYTSETINPDTQAKEEDKVVEEVKTELKDPGTIWKENDCLIDTVSCDNKSATLKIENNSKKDYSFNVHAMAVNGIMTGCNIYSFRTSVPSGKKAMMDIEFDEKWTANDNVQYVDLLIWAYDNANNMKDFDTGVIRIETNKYDKEQEFIGSEDAAEYNGISVFAKSITDSCISYSMVNNNKYFVETSLENCSINGWAFEPGYSYSDEPGSFTVSLDGYAVIIFPNSIANVNVNISDFMKENNETSVSDFEFSLKVLPNEDYFKEQHTDKIIFKNK